MRKKSVKSAARAPESLTGAPVPFPVPEAPRPELTAKRFRWWLGLITLAALLLRLGVSAELSAINGGFNSVYFPAKTTDLATYMQLGREIAAGMWPQTFYYQPFYYAVFLPLCNLISGGSIHFVIVVQSLLGALAAGLAGLAGAKLFGRGAGLWAAGLAAVSTPLLLYTPFHMYETLQSFWLALLFYLALTALEKNAFARWAWVGAVFGCAILTRGNAWLLLPGLLTALIWRSVQLKKSWRRTVLTAFVLLAATLSVQLPFAWHNSHALGRLSGPSTAADAVLALGNSKEAPPGGRDFGLPAGPMEYPEAFHQMMRHAAQGKSVARQMGEWMIAEPAAFFELQFRKLLLFWDSHEIPNNVSLYGEGMHSRLLRLLVPGRSAVILTLALAAIFAFTAKAFQKHEVPLLLLLYFLLMYWGGTALFYNLSRFRAPILPLMAAAAGSFIVLAWQTGRTTRRSEGEEREKSRRYGMHLLFCFFAGAWFVLSGWETCRHFEPNILRLARPNGTRIEGAVFDHGPQTFGDWQVVDLKAGDRLGKRFVLSEAEAKHGTLVITLYAGKEGFIDLELEGQRCRRTLTAGVNQITVPAGSPAVSIRVADVSPETAAILDAQRNYDRSTINGEAAGGEWVMRYRFGVSPEKR